MKLRIGIGVTILALFLLGIGHDSDGQASQRLDLEATDPVRSVRIELEGLTNERVVLARQALLNDQGVRAVDFDLEKKEARVKFDIDKTNLSKLEVQVRKAGFTPWFH